MNIDPDAWQWFRVAFGALAVFCWWRAAVTRDPAWLGICLISGMAGMLRR